MNAPEVGALLGSRPTGRSPLVEAYLARSGMFTPGVGDPRRYDEMTGTNGSLLPGWSDLAAELNAIGGSGLTGLTGRVDRLLEDDGVTYTPVAELTGDTDAAPATPERWRLDPLPLVVEDAEWARLEAGLIQRSTLLDAVLTDIYGGNKLIENGLLPPELVYQHPRLPATGARHHHPGRTPAVLPRRRRLPRPRPASSWRSATAPRRRPAPATRWRTAGWSPGCCRTCSAAARRAVSARSSTPCAPRWPRWRRTRPRTRGSWC